VGSLTCPLASFQELVILGGDGDDVIQLTGISGLTFAITALGGRGNDVLVGTPGNVKLFGGPGDDVLINMPGNCFSRGTGDDIVLGGGCDAGPEPEIAPLPRPAADTPEPDGLLLLGTGLLALAGTSRMRFRGGLMKRPNGRVLPPSGWLGLGDSVAVNGQYRLAALGARCTSTTWRLLAHRDALSDSGGQHRA
jgi:hypothetical protein